MSYDCSITNRKGCNYCISRKTIVHRETDITIYEEDKTLEISNVYADFNVSLEINYCPICGRKL